MSVCTHALSDMYVLVLVHICAVSARAHLGIGTQDVTARDTPEMVSVVTGNKGGGMTAGKRDTTESAILSISHEIESCNKN